MGIEALRIDGNALLQAGALVCLFLLANWLANRAEKKRRALRRPGPPR